MELDYHHINLLSNTTKAYLFEDDNLFKLIDEFSIPKNIVDAISNKKEFSKSKREILIEVLDEQYSKIELDKQALIYKNIEKLKLSNTFTITTGQQLHLFGGPLMVFYKIINAILLCKKYQKDLPQYNFVPVFWLASEDHDFEEINKININEKKYTWITNQKGAVGRFKLEELRQLINQIKEDFKDSQVLDKIEEWSQFYFKFDDYATSTQALFHYFFKNEGLLILNPDSKKLKNQIQNFVYSDVVENINNLPFEELTTKLKENNFKIQLKSKSINFFHLSNDRTPIIKLSENQFKIGELVLNQNEIKNDINNNIENYSPNAVFRPIYQELILPNLAYVGGNAEVNYWLQLLGVFKVNNVKFPMLVLRKSVLISSNKIEEILKKFNLTFYELMNIKSEADFIKHQEKKHPLIFHFENLVFESEKLNLDDTNNVFLYTIVKEKYNYFKEIKYIINNLSKNEYSKILNLKSKGLDIKFFQERNFSLLNFTYQDQNLIEFIVQNIEIEGKSVQILNI